MKKFWDGWDPLERSLAVIIAAGLAAVIFYLAAASATAEDTPADRLINYGFWVLAVPAAFFFVLRFWEILVAPIFAIAHLIADIADSAGLLWAIIAAFLIIGAIYLGGTFLYSQLFGVDFWSSLN